MNKSLKLYNLKILRRLMMIGTVSLGTGWKIGSRFNSSLGILLKVSTGAKQLGCFGYSPHIVYELTGSCNLKCLHCHAASGKSYPNELGTEDAKRVLKNLTTLKDFKVIVFSGGEPLLRKDIWELTEYAKDLGFEVLFATNATLVTKEIARKMASLKVLGAAVSLDSVKPEVHDSLRGIPGSWERAIHGINNIVSEKMFLQINVTANKTNIKEIPELIKFADNLGAHVIFLYTFVPVGRGDNNKWLALDSDDFVNLVKETIKLQSQVQAIITPVALPWYFAYLVSKSGITPNLAKEFITGCIAAKGIINIKPDGTAWPCPFLPIDSGNVLYQSAEEIWNGNVFKSIRNRNNFSESCNICSYMEVCGGCRVRAYIKTGSQLGADPICPINNKKEFVLLK
ncbi:MAG: radical SAM protein [Thermoplasmata archaeon]|nr:radical SAM protein [Thermoplasmata archaeon]